MPAEPRQTEDARQRLADAAKALRESERLLTDGSPSYAEGIVAAVSAMRGSLEGLLIWHGASLPQGAPLADLGRRAQQLVSMLRTPLQRARPLERLAHDLNGKSSLNVGEREAARTGFYSVRNLVRTVFSTVPDTIRPAQRRG